MHEGDWIPIDPNLFPVTMQVSIGYGFTPLDVMLLEAHEESMRLAIPVATSLRNDVFFMVYLVFGLVSFSSFLRNFSGDVQRTPWWTWDMGGQ